MPGKNDAHKQEYREWRLTDHGKEVYALFRAEAIAITQHRYYERDPQYPYIKFRRFERYSAQAIVYVIRYKREMKYGPDASGYKVPNNFTRYLGAEVVAQGAVPHGFFPTDDPEPKAATGQQELSLNVKEDANGATTE